MGKRTLMVSIPRSGQHLTEKMLREAHRMAGLPYSYCAFYNPWGECRVQVCKTIPCRSGCIFQKNHDYDLNVRIRKDYRHIVLYRRDFIDQMEAYFRWRKKIPVVKPEHVEDFLLFCKSMRGYYQTFLMKWTVLKVPDRTCIDYRTLIKDTEGTLASILDALGIPEKFAAAARSIPVHRQNFDHTYYDNLREAWEKFSYRRV